MNFFFFSFNIFSSWVVTLICSFELWQHCLSVPLTGNHKTCRNFPASRCLLMLLYFKQQTHLLSLKICGLQNMCPQANICSLSFDAPWQRKHCLHHTATQTHARHGRDFKTLTRPAMGVESLLTFLMMPGFNWLIKLQAKKKVKNTNLRSNIHTRT